MRSQRPVKTGDAEFAAARLPSGDEDAVVAREPPHEVLGVHPDAPDSVVEAAFRAEVKKAHPDQESGSREQFERVRNAKEAMLGGDSD